MKVLKNLFKILINSGLLIEVIEIFARNKDDLQLKIIQDLEKKIDNSEKELINLKGRISAYRLLFQEEHDYRAEFIQEFPATWRNSENLKPKLVTPK